MRTSQYLLATHRETPADAELISHQLMLRAGMIRKVGSGLYNWLPLGLRVLNKVKQIIREEMERAGAIELVMPTIQPADLWQESGRWELYGAELLRLKDRHQRDFCYGPTHEEVITDIMRKEIRSYKQLPMSVFQIQNKFRDEIRPRFGVMRAREFVMKDAYSFHTDMQSLSETYEVMFEAYCRIFTRLGLQFRPVKADSGNIGGSTSHEFQVLADSGEDLIAISDTSDYAANIELAEAPPIKEKRSEPGAAMETIDTPDQKTIATISEFLKVDPKQTVKTLIVKGSETPFVALILRGDHELNEVKADKLEQVASPLCFVEDADVKAAIGCGFGSLGPVNLDMPIIADHSAAHVADFVCGANQEAKHFINVNWRRDLPEPITADIRSVQAGEPSPDGQGHIQLTRGIEVGHIFQLGDKYSVPMNATVLNEQGKPTPMQMGCYGIGVSRIVAAAIEQNHDESGIIWPAPMAPFQLALITINQDKSAAVKEAADKLYQACLDAGIEVLLDDRNERPGVKFADMELIGIPHRLVISERGLGNQQLEYKGRCDQYSRNIDFNDGAIKFIKKVVRFRRAIKSRGKSHGFRTQDNKIFINK